VEFDADGLAFALSRVDDVGRERIVHGTVAGSPLAIILPEGAPVPASPRVSFRAEGINVYADDWRIEVAR